MIIVTISIVALSPSTSGEEFFKALQDAGIVPLVTAKVVQWIITPSIADHLLRYNWDYVLVLKPDTIIPPSLAPLIAYSLSTQIIQPDDFLTEFENRNNALLHQSTTPPTFNLDKPLIATSSQRVELTPSLLAFARSPLYPSGPVSMLNFISFHPYASAKASYAAYIEAFKAGMGSKRGGAIKIYGEVAERGEWDELVIAQYPSLEHFVDMMSDPGYQAANLRYRLPALRDTCILMTTEVQLGWSIEGSSKWHDRE